MNSEGEVPNVQDKNDQIINKDTIIQASLSSLSNEEAEVEDVEADISPFEYHTDEEMNEDKISSKTESIHIIRERFRKKLTKEEKRRSTIRRKYYETLNSLKIFIIKFARNIHIISETNGFIDRDRILSSFGIGARGIPEMIRFTITKDFELI